MATIQYVVNAVDAASATFARIAGSADEVLHKLDDIGKKSATARVALAGDKEASLTIDKLDLKLASLGKKVATGKIGVEGQARALVQIDALSLKLDELGAKHVTATVDVNVNRSSISRLRGLLSGLGAGGGAGGGGGGLFGLGQSGIGSIGFPALAGAGIVGAGLVPAAVGAGIGGLAGLGAVGGGLFGAAQGKTQLAADKANISATTAALKTAIGQQKTQLSAALLDAQKKYAKDAAFFQPFTAFQASITHLMQTVLAPLRSIMTPLAGIFNEFGKGLTALGPQFTALFKASLPFIRQFLQFMLQAGKILLPAFTQALNEMVKSGALKQMTDALVVLTQGLATFIVNLGPGMAASAQIFARLATFTARALGFLGDAFTVIAKVLTFDFPGAAAKGVHAVMASFDAFRHDVAASMAADERIIASVWNTIWRNTVTRAQNGVADAMHWIGTLPGRAGNVLATVRQVAASAWNTIWNNTVARVRSGINTVMQWIGTLPGKIRNVFHGALTWLDQAGRQVVQGLWNGLLFVWNKVKSFIGSIAGWIKAHKGPLALDSKLLEPAGKALMSGLHLGLLAGAKGPLGFITGLTGTIGSLLSGGVHALFGGGPAGSPGGGVQQWRSLVLRALAMEHLPASLVNDVLYQMQTESGGNPRAINLTDSNAAAGDPSRGLMQVIGGTFSYYHWPGTSWNIYDPLANIAAALNYAAHNGRGFGSGVGQIGSGHGYAAGGIISEPIWGIGASGRHYSFGERGPEIVIPGGGGSMSTARVEALLAQILRAVQIAPSATSAGTARALNSAARAAVR